MNSFSKLKTPNNLLKKQIPQSLEIREEATDIENNADSENKKAIYNLKNARDYNTLQDNDEDSSSISSEPSDFKELDQLQKQQQQDAKLDHKPNLAVKRRLNSYRNSSEVVIQDKERNITGNFLINQINNRKLSDNYSRKIKTRVRSLSDNFTAYQSLKYNIQNINRIASRIEDNIQLNQNVKILTKININSQTSIHDTHAPSNGNERNIEVNRSIYDDENNHEERRVLSEPIEIVSHNAQQNEIEQDQLIVAEQPMTLEEASIKLEILLFIKRVTGFNVALGLFAFALLLMINKISSFQWIFVVIYSYSIYSIAELYLRNTRYHRDPWRVREEVFQGLDILSAMIFCIYLNLKVYHVTSRLWISSIPFMLTSIAYIVWSQAPQSKKITYVLIHYTFSVQFLLISLRLDQMLDFEWEYIFIFFWTLLGFLTVHLAGYVIVLFFVFIFNLYRLCTRRQFDRDGDIIGMAWYCFYYALTLCGGLALLGVAQAYGSAANFGLLQKAASYTLGLTVFLALFTRLTSKRLVNFMARFHLQRNIEANQAVIDDSNKARRPARLRTQRKASYFVMLSSTYFLPLHSKSITIDQVNVKRVRDLLSYLPFSRLQRLEKKDLAKRSEKIKMETLKEYKAELDQRLSPKSGSPKIIFSTRQGSTTGLKKSIPATSRPRISMETNEPILKSQFSVNDVDCVRFRSLAPEITEVSENDVCYICCDSSANAILMRCGHGGVCYECAVTLLQKNGLCMECRSNIEAVHKVEPSTKFSNIIRGFEIGTIAQSESTVSIS